MPINRDQVPFQQFQHCANAVPPGEPRFADKSFNGRV